MDKELIQKLLTGIFAKLIRYALATSGGIAIAKAFPQDAPIDPQAIAIGLAEVIVPLAWSWWEDRLRAEQTSSALNAASSGATVAQALGNTTTLSRVAANLPK